MGFKEELKQKLLNMGAIYEGDGYTSFYPAFDDAEGWPCINMEKEKYEHYKQYPEDYGDDPVPQTFEEYCKIEEVDPDETEPLDCENWTSVKFEGTDDKFELTIAAGGDWQEPHNVKISYLNGKFKAEDLGITPEDVDFGKESESEKEILAYFGY